MYARAVFGVAVLAALAGAGCRQRLPAVEDREGHIIASVDGHDISVGDFERYYVAALISTGQNDTKRNRYRQLDNLIDIQLFATEARRRDLDKDSVFEVIEQRAIKKALGDRFFDVAFVESLQPLSEAEIRRGFVRQQEQPVVSHLFYRNKEAARNAHERLMAGGDFLEEARVAYDLAEIDSAAGYLGPIRYFQVDDAFAEAAYALDVGDISPPVRSRVGFHIIRVEDWLRAPIITESEFQTRRDGIESQLKLRKRRLEGDRFVQETMAGLDVRVIPRAVQGLSLVIEELENRVASTPVELSEDTEMGAMNLREIRQRVVPETVLATYTWDGRQTSFTVDDYAFWLPELPFNEARHRTAASVGRALRNDVFARAGVERGLGEDRLAIKQIEKETARFLSGRLRTLLRTSSSADSLGSEALQQIGETLGLGQSKQESREEFLRRLTESLGPLVAEVSLTKKLRAAAEIRVDTTRFEAIMPVEMRSDE